MKKPLLYVILDKQYCRSRSVAAWAQLLIEADVDFIQYRNKSGCFEEKLNDAKAIAALTNQTPVHFIVNDDPQIAKEAKADGVHLGQKDGSLQEARHRLGPTALIGVSTRSVEQARQAAQEKASYAAVGCLFDSGTKSNAIPTSLETLKQIAAAVRLPVFGIGGITQENAAAVLDHGAAGLAVCGALMRHSDPAAYCRLLKHGHHEARRV